jgi:hypothetical protein
VKILVACEYSGVVRRAFAAKGHEVYSCDLLPSEDNSQNHIQDDVLNLLKDHYGWDMMIAHPPCTYLTCAAEWAYGPGPYHQKLKPDIVTGFARQLLRQEAAEFFFKLLNANVDKICVENPVGIISRQCPPDQYIQPYEFGNDASKKTGLWLKNLPKLVATKYYPPRIVNNKLRWGNQTDSGQNRLSPSKQRGHERSRTYDGIAEAMAEQWG